VELEKEWPDEFVSEGNTMVGSPVGGSTEACGDPIRINAVHQTLSHPITATFYTMSGFLRQLHPHAAVSNRRHLRHGEALPTYRHHGVTVFLHHALHLLKVATSHSIRSHAPVKWVTVTVTISILALFLWIFHPKKHWSDIQKLYIGRGTNQIKVVLFVICTMWDFPGYREKQWQVYIEIHQWRQWVSAVFYLFIIDQGDKANIIKINFH